LGDMKKRMDSEVLPAPQKDIETTGGEEIGKAKELGTEKW